jgi:hypothetical protein
MGFVVFWTMVWCHDVGFAPRYILATHGTTPPQATLVLMIFNCRPWEAQGYVKVSRWRPIRPFLETKVSYLNESLALFFMKASYLNHCITSFERPRLRTWMKTQLFFVLWKLKVSDVDESLAIFRITKFSYWNEGSAIFRFFFGKWEFLTWTKPLDLKNPLFTRHSPSQSKVKPRILNVGT